MKLSERWAMVKSILFGDPDSVMPIGCLTFPIIAGFGVYYWLKNQLFPPRREE